MDTFNTKNIKNDPIVKRLISKMPEDIADSFSSEQLFAIKIAFGARKWTKHPVDIRGIINIWRWRYYYVILAGKDKRQLSRKEEQAAFIFKASLLFFFLIFCAGVGILVLYLIKSALGIDLISGYSTGIWDWFKNSF